MDRKVGLNRAANDPKSRTDPADRSLRANGETYRDRNSETEKIYSRLMKSSASVIGIAGQRGAGKSSLALRLIGRAEKDGAYAQLIHLPTVNNSREFLISIFQRVCEEVVSRIDSRLGHERSLEEIATASIGRSVVHRRLIVAALLLLIVLPSLFLRFPAVIDTLLGAVNGYSAIQQQLMDPLFLILAFAFVIVVVLASIGLRKFLDISRQIRITERNPDSIGLRLHALELLEHLEYQTTLSSNQEAGIQLPQVSAMLSSGKSLAARPLSLPGISAQFTQFLDYVALSHPTNRVVICLDELDKIENPRDLDKLLRGIKGILGHPNTHFLLTVSEDALARYVKQRRLEKGILESAFEEIVPLRPIGPRVARHVVGCICPAEDTRNSNEIISVPIALLWLFGSGNPREIKRNVLTCLEAGVEPYSSPAIAIWEQLLRSRLDEMSMWASNVGTNDEITYRFLCRLQDSEKLLEQVDGSDPLNLGWAREFADLWKKKFGLDKLISSAQQTGKKLTDAEVAHAGAAVDILLGGSGLAFVLEKGSKMSSVTIEQLSNIFEIRTFNVAFAGRALEKYLAQIRISQ